MQMLRCLLSMVLLAGIAAAQTSLSSAQNPASTGSQASSTDPLQAQQNPLSNAPRTTDTSTTPKPTFDTSTSSSGGQDQMLGEVRMMLRNTELGGDTTQSFLSPGVNDLGEVNFFEDRHFLTTQRIQILAMVRGTNDYSIDPETTSLQKAYIRIYGARDEYIVGDALMNFSRLSLQQNIKGVSTAWKLGDKWKLSLINGIYIDRYGSLYKDIPSRPYMSWVDGARLEYKINKSSIVGANFISSEDKTDSLPEQPVGFAPWPASNRLGTIDGRFNIKGLRLDSEIAYSWTDFDKRQSSNCTISCDSREPQPELGTQGDWAGRIEGIYRYHRWTFRGAYARYEPNFASIQARQIPDLQDMVARVSYDVNDYVSLDATVRRANDDLKEQLPYETTLLGPEARVSFHNLPFYTRGIFDVGYRYRDTHASDGSINRTLSSPFVEFTLPYHSTYFSVGYERRGVVDYVQVGETGYTNRVYMALRGLYDIGGWHINPMFRFEFERQGGIPDYPTNLLGSYDTNRLNTFGLFVEPPKWFIAELAYRNSDATLYGPNGFNRPSYKAALTYKVRNDQNILLIFAFERNTNTFASLLPYDERVYGVTLDYKFGRKAKR